MNEYPKKWRATVLRVYPKRCVHITDAKGDIEVFPHGCGRCQNNLKKGTVGVITYYPKKSGLLPTFEADKTR